MFNFSFMPYEWPWLQLSHCWKRTCEAVVYVQVIRLSGHREVLFNFRSGLILWKKQKIALEYGYWWGLSNYSILFVGYGFCLVYPFFASYLIISSNYNHALSHEIPSHKIGLNIYDATLTLYKCKIFESTLRFQSSQNPLEKFEVGDWVSREEKIIYRLFSNI